MGPHSFKVKAAGAAGGQHCFVFEKGSDLFLAFFRDRQFTTDHIAAISPDAPDLAIKRDGRYAWLSFLETPGCRSIGFAERLSESDIAPHRQYRPPRNHGISERAQEHCVRGR